MLATDKASDSTPIKTKVDETDATADAVDEADEDEVNNWGILALAGKRNHKI